MFRRRTRPEPLLPPEVVQEAIPATRQPAVTLHAQNWQDVVNALIGQGYGKLACPGMCRRKGDHAHLRHDAASADVTVFPAAVERGGA